MKQFSNLLLSSIFIFSTVFAQQNKKTNLESIQTKLKFSTHAPVTWIKALSESDLIDILITEAAKESIPVALEIMLTMKLGFKSVKSVNCLNKNIIPNQFIADNNGELSNPKTCENFKRVANIIQNVDSMIGSNLKGATSLNNLSIVIVSELSNAFYFPLLKTIFIPKMFYLPYPVISQNPDPKASEEEKILLENYVKVSKNPKFLDSVIAHEYGHYLFDHNYGQLQAKAYIANPLSCEGIEFISGINELTADMVAVSLTLDPKGVADALFHTGLINTKAPKKGEKVTFKKANDQTTYFSTFRDFSNRDNRIEKVAQLISNGSNRFNIYISLFHNYFAPVRYHLWNYYLSNPTYFAKNNRGIEIKKILDTILNATVEMVRTKPQGNPIEDKSCLTSRKVVSDNQGLITILDQNLK